MQDDVDHLANLDTRADLVLLKLSASIVYQIAHAVSNTLKHTHTAPVFAAVTVEAMIDSVNEAYHQLQSRAVRPVSPRRTFTLLNPGSQG